MTPTTRLAQFLKLTAPAWAPWVLVVGAHQIANLFPGTIKVDHCRTFAALCFMSAGTAAVAMVWRGQKPTGGKVVLCAALAAVFTFLALMISMRPRCGDEPVYIGSAPNKLKPTTSCE